MQKLIKIFILFFVINSGIIIKFQNTSAQNQRVSFQVFYDDLSPHGTWYQSADYGYVWRPNTSSAFTPYSTNGYWVLTDFGWTWVSDYSWGWAPFHYGRWHHDPFHGYVWVPDYEWGPGWVSWRRTNDYYGWAPLGPGMSYGTGYNNYNIPYNNWRFVNCRNFGRRDIHNYYINTTNNTTIINNSTVINNTQNDQVRNTTYNTGPDRQEVVKKIGRPVKPVAIIDDSKPGQHVSQGGMKIYRPVIDNIENATVKPAPSKVVPLKDATPSVKQQNPNELAGSLNQPVKQAPVKQQPAPDAKQGEVTKIPVQKPAINKKIPAQATPVQDERRDEAVKEAPIKQAVGEDRIEQPINEKATPVKQQPVRDERITQPIKEAPAQQQPQRDERVNQQELPVQQQPVREERITQPVREVPVQQQPIRQERINQPVREAPAQQQPAREQRVEQPRNPSPAQQQPARQQSVSPPVRQQQPVKQQPPPANRKD